MRKTMPSAALAASALILVAACSNQSNVSFSKDVSPVLNTYCAECHTGVGEGVQASGYDVGTYDKVMRGTKYGPVVVAGDSPSSTLYRMVAGKVDKSIQMPHGKEALKPEEIVAIEQWIDQGAANN